MCIVLALFFLHCPHKTIYLNSLDISTLGKVSKNIVTLGKMLIPVMYPLLPIDIVDRGKGVDISVFNIFFGLYILSTTLKK